MELAKATVAQHLKNREDNFLTVLEEGIYGQSSSPYRRLLLHAGLEFDDVRAMDESRSAFIQRAAVVVQVGQAIAG